ncbi:MAG: HIT domain-containing protein [SAR202 cluster bacterium]|nr:HIT domain-containing protein [SAR202 cluster bacterium]
MNFELPEVNPNNCIFCKIVSGTSEAKWERSPDSSSAVACFHNRLKWVRVMLLVVPVLHTTQIEFWGSDIFAEAAQMAVEIGDINCSSEGYRLISNFGYQAHQSITHAHIHIISGESKTLQTTMPKNNILEKDSFEYSEYDLDEIPFASKISPTSHPSQRDMWRSSIIKSTATAALDLAKSKSPQGFRLISTFSAASSSEQTGANYGGIFVLGGGMLKLYANS